MLTPNDLLLFQGDSITDGFRKPEEVGTSYRLGAGYAMICAARLAAERPELNLRFDNRGVSGRSLRQMAKQWQEDAVDLEPDVLSVLIGVNDTLQAIANPGRETPESSASFGDRYAELLDAVRERKPGVRLVLLEPFLLKTGKITDDHLENLAPRQQAIAELAARYEAAHVPLQARFDAAAEMTGPDYWLFDGIHPNASGQWLIATAWWDAVGIG
ncbi:MAG: SGNH/GDSL hydrolase family protein [Phycisphaeraceae bacterium]